MDSYDFRNRKAASMDLHDQWRDIVDEHRKQEYKDFSKLLKKAALYLGSVGFDLLEKDSYLEKYYSGSDGVRMAGQLVIRDRDENTVKMIEFGESEGKKRVTKWVDQALNVYGSVRYKGDNTWVVDITES